MAKPKSIDDPFGVMIKPKIGTRKCDTCGCLLLIGKYKFCDDCQPTDCSRHSPGYSAYDYGYQVGVTNI